MGPHSGTGAAGAGAASEAEACVRGHDWRQLCDHRGPIVQGPFIPECPSHLRETARIYRAIFFCTRCLATRGKLIEGRLYFRGNGTLTDPTGQQLSDTQEE